MIATQLTRGSKFAVNRRRRTCPRPRPDINWRIAIQCAILYQKDIESSAAVMFCLPTVIMDLAMSYVPDRHTPRELARIAEADWTSKIMDAPREVVQLISDYLPFQLLAYATNYTWSGGGIHPATNWRYRSNPSAFWFNHNVITIIPPVAIPYGLSYIPFTTSSRGLDEPDD